MTGFIVNVGVVTCTLLRVQLCDKMIMVLANNRQRGVNGYISYK